MGLLVALAFGCIGAPLGLIVAIVGILGMIRNRHRVKQAWPKVCLVIGVLLLSAGCWMLYEISNTNFGL